MNAYALLAAAIPAGYQLTAIAACWKRLGFEQKLSGFAPAVSILKPIRGADSSFYEAIRTQAQIDYPGPFESSSESATKPIPPSPSSTASKPNSPTARSAS